MNSFRLRQLANLDQERMLRRYESECKELGSHMETEAERRERIKRNEYKKKCIERYTLPIKVKRGVKDD